MFLGLKETVLVAGLVLAARGEKAFVFQPDNELTAESFATLYLSTSQEVLSDLTACAWFKVFHFRGSSSYLFSYATSDKDNNEMNFGLKPERVFGVFGGNYVYSPVQSETAIFPGRWYHMCIAADSEGGKGIVYLNGQASEEEMKDRNILTNGSLVLGQETDMVGGGFQAEQSFSGIITAFNLYSRALSQEEVHALGNCSGGVAEGDLVAWSTSSWGINPEAATEGLVKVVEVLPSEYCNPQRFDFSVFGKRMPFKDAWNFCRHLKTRITIPRSNEENRVLYEAVEGLAQQCQPPNHNKGFFWLGAKDEVEEGEWRDEENVPLNYTNFEGAARSNSKDCSGLLVPPYREVWDEMSCGNTYHFCVTCQELQPVVMKMRGLCEENEKEAWFRMERVESDRPNFRGFSKYYISYGNNLTWSLVNMWTRETVAFYFTYNGGLPFGTHNWTTTTNYDICEKPEGSLHALALSACYPWEFSCEDGACINLTERCDLRVNCPDNSDEKGCEKLLLPEDYLPALPPPGVEPGPLGLNITVRIQGFSQVDIRDMKLTVDLSTTISWHDLRVRYQNLKPLADLNYMDPTSVWTPTVEFVNADFPRIYKTQEVLTVARSSAPEEDDPSRIAHDEIYEGSKNPLLLTQKINAPFSCAMDLQNFPFDTQHCKLLIRITSAREEFLQWSNLTVIYLGERMLTEYEVGDMTIRRRKEAEYSLAVVGMIFYRRYWYYLTSAYLPTIMLMLISYASLFCKRDNRDLRVMMAITTLLVLYALYQQISDGLPRTSYTKAVDVWCFFAITFIFSQVIFHVAIDVEMTWPRRIRASPRVKEIDLTNKPRRRCPPLVVARVLYALLLVLFCLIYWVVVLVDKNRGEIELEF
ncbi:uncharacterized protein LOC125034558 [Penaeus chinensis]|uniref:uncharacterized protein LOC125034558 n=1 Tax=Penaeus chinensis TaxID=139456 RepID=UPI001FB75CA5|nr:uncharacterized protein LOC125034558 [Penaeus chinensis]